MPSPNLSHICPKDRPCAFCLIKEGKDIPAELLVAYTPRPIPPPRLRLTSDAREVAHAYSALPTRDRWLVKRFLNELAAHPRRSFLRNTVRPIVHEPRDHVADHQPPTLLTNLSKQSK